MESSQNEGPLGASAQLWDPCALWKPSFKGNGLKGLHQVRSTPVFYVIKCSMSKNHECN